MDGESWTSLHGVWRHECGVPEVRSTAFPAVTMWRRLLIYVHRWLGIAGGGLFFTWFLSGIVLMYAGMPALSSDERLRRAPLLDLSTATIDVAEAAVAAGVAPSQIVVGMHGDRPVYRFAGPSGWTRVYADTGELGHALTSSEALAVAHRFAPGQIGIARYDVRLTAPDQWTLQSRPFFPLHRVHLGDRADTVLYVSGPTAQPVMMTTRSGRRLAYVGAVLHWLYFTPLRSNVGLWADVVIWLSVFGCVLCLSGLIWGLWRLSWSGFYRLRARYSRSPYDGLMRWHHYAGLAFGVFTFTWVFSGALSMEPWSWHPGTAPTGQQRQAMTGGLFRLGPLTAERLRAAHDVIGEAFVPAELEVLQFRGEPHVWARDASLPLRGAEGLPTTLASLSTQPLDQRLVSLERLEAGGFAQFDASRIEEAAGVAMPGATVVESTWLRAYDDYYYDRSRQRRLPVLRVKYDDANATWLYFDPFRGAIARKEQRLTRVNRWLYHGLHSLDFPWLYARRPLWDIVVVLLSLGGIAVSVTPFLQAASRLKRHLARIDRGLRKTGS